MHTEVKKSIEAFVKNADLRKAVGLLEGVPEFRQLAIMLASRLSHSERLFAEGRISQENFEVKYNSLTHDLLFLIGNDHEHPSRKLPSAIPPRPLNYIDREKLIEIKDALLANDDKYFGVFGQHGVGKTVLIAELARSKEIQVAFDGGIYWVGFNIGNAESLGESGPVPYQKKLYQQLVQSDAKDFNVKTWYEGLTMLQIIAASKLGDAKCLIIVDHPFGVDYLLDAIHIHENATFLIITNDSSLLYTKGLRENFIFEIDVLSKDESLFLLSEWIEISVKKMPESASEVIELLGYLPLAVAMVGANLKGRLYDLSTAVADMVEIINEGELKTEHPVDNFPWSKLESLFNWVLKRLTKDEQAMFSELGMFPQAWLFKIDSFIKIWNNYKPRDVRRFIQKLLDKALLQKSGDDSFVVHNLMRLHLRATLQNPLPVFEKIALALFTSIPLPILAAFWGENNILMLASVRYSLNIESDIGITPLAGAALNDRQSTIDALLELGSNLEHRNTRGETALYGVARQGKIKGLKYLIEKGADVNAFDNKSHTPLHAAAAANEVEVVRILIDNGADYTCKSKDHLTLLMVAVVADSTAVLAELLKYISFDAPLTKDLDYSILDLAITAQSDQTVKLLLNTKVSANFSLSKTGLSPLHLACVKENADIVKMLIDKGAAVNASTIEKLTPLHVAIYHGNLEVIQLLLISGAELDSKALGMVRDNLSRSDDPEKVDKFQQIATVLLHFVKQDNS